MCGLPDATQECTPVTEPPIPPEPTSGLVPENAPVRLNADVPHATPERVLDEVARRALLEAAARRALEVPRDLPPEDGGPRGPEPTRYGDWEKKGIAVDF